MQFDITDVPADTKDKDEILESEFFDTRQAFLSLCQGNHYQYDTLRRAKHSSMMVLYHLHNPTAPAFVTTCNICHLDIETGQGWRCEVCPEYDVCNNCYQKEGGVDHHHKLTNHPSIADRDAQNKEARQMRVLQVLYISFFLIKNGHRFQLQHDLVKISHLCNQDDVIPFLNIFSAFLFTSFYDFKPFQNVNVFISLVFQRFPATFSAFIHIFQSIIYF